MIHSGTFCQSLQYVYEEKVMAGDVQAPPWLLIGMEGFFGARLLHERRLPDRSRCRTPGSLSP